VRRLSAALAVLAALALGATQAVAGSAPPAARASSHTPVSLAIVFDDGSGSRKGARLTCREELTSATGFLARRDPRRLCRTARLQARFLASQPDPDRICPQIYGGPQTARFRGTVGSRRINRLFARRDGCEMDDWDRVAAMLPRVPQPQPTEPQPTY
jgi:hypothetical protein